MNRVLCTSLVTIGIILFQHAIASNANAMPPASSPVSATQGAKAGNSQNPLIEKTCATSPYKDACIKTLTAQPGADKADIKTLTFISLNITRTYGRTIEDWIAQKLEDSEAGPEIEQALTDCSDQYTDAMAQLEDSLVAFFSNANNDVKTWMSTALTNANTCEEGLKEGNAADVMGDMNQIFTQYCSNALAFSNELAKQKH